jgi:hypothetical protein
MEESQQVTLYKRNAGLIAKIEYFDLSKHQQYSCQASNDRIGRCGLPGCRLRQDRQECIYKPQIPVTYQLPHNRFENHHIGQGLMKEHEIDLIIANLGFCLRGPC